MAPKLRLVAALYLSQYLGIGFLYFGLNGILRQQGVSLESLAAVQAFGLVWVLKALWAPLVDRYRLRFRGHYRSWLLITQPLIGLSLLAMLPFPPTTHLTTVLIFFGIYVVVSATQDIATDAVVSRYVPASRQGMANAVATIGSWLANILGGGLVLVLYDKVGWQAAIVALTLLALAPLPLILSYREPQVTSTTPLAGHYRAMGSLFRLPGVARWLLLALPTLWAGSVAAYGLLTPLLIDAGWTLTDIGLVMGMTMPLPASLGALAAGRIQRHIPAKRLLPACGVAVLLATFAMSPAFFRHPTMWMMVVGIAVYIAVMAAVSTVIYTVHMSMTRPDSSGADFTTLTAIGTLWTTIIGMVAMTMAAYLGYFATAVIFGLVSAVGGVIAGRIARTFAPSAVPARDVDTPDKEVAHV